MKVLCLFSVVVVFLVDFHPSSFLERLVVFFSIYVSRASLFNAPKFFHAKIAFGEIFEEPVARLAPESNGF